MDGESQGLRLALTFLDMKKTSSFILHPFTTIWAKEERSYSQSWLHLGTLFAMKGSPGAHPMSLPSVARVADEGLEDISVSKYQ